MERQLIDITNINEKVYDFLKKGIINLNYPPGGRIDIRKPQQELGVSHTPIKDALFRLAGKGWLKSVLGGGPSLRRLPRGILERLLK